MPTESAAIDRAAQLYDAAVKLFLQRGYRDVDVAEIVAEVGLSHGSFYNYYRNKRDILDAIQRGTEAKLVAAINAVKSCKMPCTRDDFVSEIVERIEAAMRVMVNDTELMAFVTITAAGVDDASFRETVAGFSRVAAVMTEVLARGREQGWVRDAVNLEFAGQAVVSAMVMTMLPVLMGGTGEFDTHRAAKTCAVCLMTGMRRLAASG